DATYVVLAFTATGEVKFARCQPLSDSPLNMAVAMPLPVLDHRVPTCGPVFELPLKKRRPVMKPLRSGWNLTPTSMAAGSAFEALTGAALLGQMVHGQVTGPIVGVAVGVAVGGAGVAVG